MRNSPSLRRVSFWAGWWGKFRRHLRENALIRRGDAILVAVSGGPDSVCLAHALHLLKARWGLRLRLVHVHHNLRPAADAEERLVGRLGNRWGLPVTLRRTDVPAFSRRTKRSIEEAGRKLRYAVFLREARRNGLKKVATAHHLDDHAETVLLNLLRGTHPRGLAGIPVKRPLARAVEVIRPLLCFRKSEILEYLRFWRLPYRTDRSNRDTRFTRNWIRRRLLPLLESKNPRIREHLYSFSRSKV